MGADEDRYRMTAAAICKPDGETRFNPSPEEPLAHGDRLLAIGQAQSLKDLERRLA
jgi:K+/H+ antiporter YhaU regulatory subunit KhtT